MGFMKYDSRGLSFSSYFQFNCKSNSYLTPIELISLFNIIIQASLCEFTMYNYHIYNHSPKPEIREALSDHSRKKLKYRQTTAQSLVWEIYKQSI